MPSPTETEFRVQDSPVPTQTICGLFASIATAPMDCTDSLSNTGLKVVAPSIDFHTPPLAAPTKRVVRPPSLRAAIAEIRPLMVAEPMFRAPRPDTMPPSNCAALIAVGGGRLACAGVTAATLVEGT